MGQFLQQIAPFIVPILIVVFSVGARVAKWASEKQAERQMIQRQQRARDEALRTGKPMADPGTVDLSPKEVVANTKATGQARLEALRQQRIEQLRRIREQRSGSSSSSTQSPARPAPKRAPRPAPGRTLSAQSSGSQPQPDPRRAALQAAQRRKEQAERIAIEERRKQLEIARRRAELSRVTEQTEQNARRSGPAEGQSRLSKLRVNPQLNVHVGKLHADHADRPIESSFQTLTSSSSRKQMRTVMGNRAAIRHAIIVNELLKKPVALRATPSDF